MLFRSLCEAQGAPLGLAHDGANRHDSKLLAATLDSVPIERPEPTPARPQRLCLDRGYDYQPVRELVAERGFTPHIRSRGEEIALKLRTPGWRARRWVSRVFETENENAGRGSPCSSS